MPNDEPVAVYRTPTHLIWTAAILGALIAAPMLHAALTIEAATFENALNRWIIVAIGLRSPMAARCTAGLPSCAPARRARSARRIHDIVALFHVDRETPMTLEQLYFISQTISAVAIVASLIYVALQLRQTERNQRAIIQQGRAARNLALTMRQTESEMATLMNKAGSEWASMSDVELLQFIGWTRGILFHFEDSYLQHLDGLMDERAFASARSSLASILARPASRATWEVTRTFHSPAFTKYVDDLVRDAPLSLGVPTTAWKAKMAELVGGTPVKGALPA